MLSVFWRRKDRIGDLRNASELVYTVHLLINGYLFLLHRSLQYFTDSQSFAHFLRHVNGFWQTTQYFTGKSLFFMAMQSVDQFLFGFFPIREK